MVAVRTLPPELAGGEVGSAFPPDRLFAYWENGKVFEPGPIEVRDLAQMLRVDGKAGNLEAALTLPLRGAPWQVRARKGDKGEAAKVTEWLTRPAAMGGMRTPMQLLIGQMTGGTIFRKAFFEKTFKINDQSEVVYDAVAWRPPQSCYLARDENNAVLAGFKQRTWRGKRYIDVDIPAQRSFVFIHGQHRDPIEGTSDLEVAYAVWQTKQKIRFLWAMFLENLAMPRVLAQAENDGEQDEVAKKIAKLKGGGVAALRPGDSATALETSQGAAATFEQAIKYCDSEMSNSVLAGFTDLSSMASSGRGSLALSRDQSDFFTMGREAVLREMSMFVEQDIVAPLVRYNFGADGVVPEFILGPLSEGDAAQAVSLLQALAVSPSMTTLPWVFIEQLAGRVATYLDLDADKVMSAFEAREKTGTFPEASKPLHAAVAQAADMMHQAATGQPVDAEARQLALLENPQ